MMSDKIESIEALKADPTKAVVVADENGIIIYSNEAFAQMFGWSPEEALGQPLAMIIPEDMHDAHHMGFSRFLASEEPKIMHQALTLPAVKRDGTTFNAVHYLMAEKIDGKWQIGALLEHA